MDITRREMFARLGNGLGGLAMAALVSESTSGATVNPGPHNLSARQPHVEPRARSIIQLFMHGGPSHVDMLDPKPMLDRYDGRPQPYQQVDEGSDPALLSGNILKSPFRFHKHGQSGLEFSEVMPHIARHADRIAVIRSMYAEHFLHDPAVVLMQTGRITEGRPSLGAWVIYGLGTLNQNLPAFVVLCDPRGAPACGFKNWTSGWMPPIYQGTPFRTQGSPVLNLRPSTPRPQDLEENRLRLLRDLNEFHRDLRPQEAVFDSRMATFELAARMQLSATDSVDLSQETEATRRLYGLDNAATRSYGERCLMARRLVERGVRFIQVFMQGDPWDTHSNNANGIRNLCRETDLPIGGLLTDLQQRGLLDSTLVFWGGEFGRSPGAQSNDGRNHHPYGFSVWLAGGGIKGGQAYGATDEFGYHAIVNRTSVAQLHATMLYALGLDHMRLTYQLHGRDERPSGDHSPPVIHSLF